MSEEGLTLIKGEDKERLQFTRRLSKCKHSKMYYSDHSLALECQDCGERLNPVSVLLRYLRRDSWHIENAKKAQKKIDELENRNRTKCEHCLKMTRIIKRIY